MRRRRARLLARGILLTAALGIFGSAALSSPAAQAAQDPEEEQGVSPKLPDGRQRAFPTAEGFGAAAKGGRGGRVIYVTNTEESGPGSLRACIEALGPRTCVFRTGGEITLEETSLKVVHPYLTIAGETAPGGGVAIRNGDRQIRPSLEIRTHDVIIRHLRLRPGPHAVEACCSGALGLYTGNAHDVMLDHISASWGSDETVDSEDAAKITWQWGIVSEPLLDGGPGKSNRARNMLFRRGGDISVHHSLFAMGKFRNPQMKPGTPGAVGDFVNNVLYSPEWQYVISFSDEWAQVQANVVGNYKLAGKKARDDRLVHLFHESGRGFSIYAADNFDETYMSAPDADDRNALAPQNWPYLAAERFDAPLVRTSSPQEAYAQVLARAGAVKPVRDAVDRRVIEAVKNRAGAILETHPEDVGGWPALAAGAPYPDRDGDGVADDWERAHHMDENDPGDGALDFDGDGWTNLEEFLHALAGDMEAY
jgi:hypothetical protein